MSDQVLLIDDDPEFLELYQELLISEGLEVFAASNFEQAETYLKENGHLVDLIFCDIYMPKEDGFEVLKRISMDPFFGKIPFILKTSSPDQGLFEKALVENQVELVNTLMSNAEIIQRVKKELFSSRLLKFSIHNQIAMIIDDISSALVYPKHSGDLEFNEFEKFILKTIAQNTEPVAKEVLIHSFYGENYIVTDNNFNTILSNLRKKITFLDLTVKTLRGQGVVLCRS